MAHCGFKLEYSSIGSNCGLYSYLYYAAPPSVFAGAGAGEDPEAEGQKGEQEDCQEDQGYDLAQMVVVAAPFEMSCFGNCVYHNKLLPSLPVVGSVQTLSVQTSSSSQRIVSLQKTQGLWMAQLSPFQTAHLVQL